MEATQQLQAVRDLLLPEDRYLRSFLDDTISGWAEDQRVTGRKALLNDVIAEANGSANSDEISARLAAVIALYKDDPSVAAEVQQCRDLQKVVAAGGDQRAPAEAEDSP